MSEKKQNSIQAQWEDRAQAGEVAHVLDLPVVLRPYDVTVLLDDEGGMLNPLLDKVAGLIGENVKAGDGKVSLADGNLMEGLLSLIPKLPALRNRINDLLKKVLVEPDPATFDIDNFTLQEKIRLFTYIIGGEGALGRAEAFLERQSADMATVPAGETVRTEAQPSAGD